MSVTADAGTAARYKICFSFVDPFMALRQAEPTSWAAKTSCVETLIRMFSRSSVVLKTRSTMSLADFVALAIVGRVTGGVAGCSRMTMEEYGFKQSLREMFTSSKKVEKKRGAFVHAKPLQKSALAPHEVGAR